MNAQSFQNYALPLRVTIF